MGGRGDRNRRGRFSIPPTPAGDFMRRHVLPTAFLTFVYLLAVAVGQPPQPAARFVSPPGATQPLVAPKLAPQPVDVDPVPDTLGGEFAIVATKDTVATDGTIATVEQTDDAVSVVPGELLTLTVRGDVVLPVDGQAVPAVSWAISRRTGNAKIYPADGHHVTFSAPATDAGVYLFTAAVNNPDHLGAPFLAQRWVVVRGAQPPPDDVEPAKPVEPTEPVKPAPSAVTAVVYVYEKDGGGVPSGVRVALDKLNRQGIFAAEFEDDTTNGADNVPLQYQIPLNAARAKSLPGELKPSLVVVRGTIPEVWHDVRTEKDVLEAAK